MLVHLALVGLQRDFKRAVQQRRLLHKSTMYTIHRGLQAYHIRTVHCTGKSNTCEELYYCATLHDVFCNCFCEMQQMQVCHPGLQDPRVPFWGPAKFVARLRAVKTGSEEVLLLTDIGWALCFINSWQRVCRSWRLSGGCLKKN
jgi:hypothetical protein